MYPPPLKQNQGLGGGGALHRPLPWTNPAGIDEHIVWVIRGSSPPRHIDQPTKCRIHCHTTRRGLSQTEAPSTPILMHIFKNRIFFYTHFKRVNKRIHWFRVHRKPISGEKNSNIRYAVWKISEFVWSRPETFAPYLVISFLHFFRGKIKCCRRRTLPCFSWKRA